jgi:lipoprotein-anchoring transpeptidase ErfK/SrfK
MQSLVLSVFLTSTLLIGPALAGPQSLSPEVPRNNRPVLRVQQVPVEQRSGSAYAAPLPAEAQAASQPRPAAASNFGGGFLEVLFGGGSRSAPPTSVYYGNQPVGDLGPGMVESPNSPGRPVVDPRYMRQEVSYNGPEEPGTVIVNTNQRMLYLVQSKGRAIRYGIGVGRPGFTWSGTHHVTNKREWPDWTPPPEMLQRRPDLPRHMEGGPENPLGARAMYLGSTLYRIHGSNEPWTIGTQVSSGCIRMRNEDVVDLYPRVKVGTRVIVM